jgi:hypothetical protein
MTFQGGAFDSEHNYSGSKIWRLVFYLSGNDITLFRLSQVSQFLIHKFWAIMFLHHFIYNPSFSSSYKALKIVKIEENNGFSQKKLAFH